ncbi:MAG: hypothetical protein HOW73_48445 [Polyangiaceae bacterium]|nr:hypothetical protein [Polyangiaceae bacterium]
MKEITEGMSNRKIAYGLGLAAALQGAALTACSSPGDAPPSANAEPTAIAETSAAVVQSASASSSSTAAIASIPAGPPRLKPVARFEPMGFGSLQELGDTIVVTGNGNKVGKLSRQGVEWAVDLPEDDPPETINGAMVMQGIAGRYPDKLGVIRESTYGRWPRPTWQPVKGNVAAAVTFAPGGGPGSVLGAVVIDDTTLIAGWDHFEGARIVHAGGPWKGFSVSTFEEGCGKKSQYYRYTAISPTVFGATRAGTAFFGGQRCDDEGPALEIWGAAGGKSKIFPLEGIPKDAWFHDDFVRGNGDVAWVVAGDRVIEVSGGKPTILPPLGGPGRTARIFGGDGKVYAVKAGEIKSLEGGAWKLVATLPWPAEYPDMVAMDGSFWATSSAKLYELVPNTEPEGECKTPFVFLYDVSYKSEPNYTFPTTRKALATFPDIDKLQLVDFVEGGRRLGLVVPSKEVGEAVIAHVKGSMKDEDPRLVCYAPAKPRVVSIKP